jgi:E3 ubiquitin-protein ligase MARCH6
MELSSDDICRVCRLNGTPERPLFHPCLCTGSIRYVHQDCLMQWLRHSQKEYCELCHYKFQFASIYRADMPKWLPINYVYKTLVNILSRKFHKWFHLFVVFIIWLYFLPVCTCKFITIVILYLTRIIIIVTIQYNTEVHTCSILIASFYE